MPNTNISKEAEQWILDIQDAIQKKSGYRPTKTEIVNKIIENEKKKVCGE